MIACVEAAGVGSAGATRLYECPRRDQLFLMPVCMRDWLEEGHLAWFVLDVVVPVPPGPPQRNFSAPSSPQSKVSGLKPRFL